VLFPAWRWRTGRRLRKSAEAD